MNGICFEHSWKSLACELCHKMLPGIVSSFIKLIKLDVFMKKGQPVELIDITKPNTTCIILEALPKENQTGKSFYVIPTPTTGGVKLVNKTFKYISYILIGKRTRR